MVKRILPADSSIATSPSPVSISRCTSPTVLRGTMMPGMPAAPSGSGSSTCARRWPSVATARSVGVLAVPGGVQVDAVQVIARLLGRDRELGLVDQPLEIGGGELERMRHLAGGEIGEVAFRQGLQGEARATGAQRQHGAVAGALDDDLRALGQLAHDLVEHVRRHGGGAARRDLGGDAVGDFEIEVGGLQAELALVGLDQHVGENRDGVAPLHHAMHVAQRLQQFCTLDCNFHWETRFGAYEQALKPRRDAKPAVRGMRGRGAKVTRAAKCARAGF